MLLICTLYDLINDEMSQELDFVVDKTKLCENFPDVGIAETLRDPSVAGRMFFWCSRKYNTSAELWDTRFFLSVDKIGSISLRKLLGFPLSPIGFWSQSYEEDILF